MASPAGRTALEAAAAITLLVVCVLPALSKPVITDPRNCVDANPTMKCCPRQTDAEAVNFELPEQPVPLRVRQPAHALSPEDAQKYEKAVALMRALPDDHPWNFIQQANVHCAYCSGSHFILNQNRTIEIHSSWLFFIWHRAYLFFYERILGKLINDKSLALPFWNWDSPAGMSIPLIYRDSKSSLYNPTRYQNAINFTDLGECRNKGAPGSFDEQQQCNLRIMHRQFVAASNSTSLFFGSPLRAGDANFPGGGTLENSPHSPVHIRTGSDMSLITRAARDPLFFIHHSNIDRLWAIWDGIRGNSSNAITDPDFLDASFLFWDENMRLVRIKGRDLMDTKKLGYVYKEVPMQWMDIETAVEPGQGGMAQTRFVGAAINDVVFPVLLRGEVRVRAARRPQAENEMLVVSGIELDRRDHVWFSVYVSRVNGGGGRVEAGCFIQMERRAEEKIPIVTKLQIGITEFIKDIGADKDDLIDVILAPKVGGEKVTVGGVSIM